MPPDVLRQLTREARALLTFQGELGLRGLDVPADLLAPDGRAGAKESLPAPASSARESAARAVAALGGAEKSTRPAVCREAASSPSDRSLSPELRALRDELGDCRRCKLHTGRTHIVFGVGHPHARLMFVGEGPGRDEDLQGEPFVGAAGQLLDRMIKAMGLSRSEVYIANIVKCRPPRNRDPEPDEIAACEGFLRAQIRVVAPEVLVALGRVAAQTLLREETPITRLRGRWRQYEGVPLMPTYHPAYLLRNPAEKRPVWDDLQQVMKRLNPISPPEKVELA